MSESPGEPPAAARGAAVDLIPSLRIVRTRDVWPNAGSTALLTLAQRRRVSEIATRVEVRSRSMIFRSGQDADSVFIVASGVVKAAQDLPSGKRLVVAFWFARDLFGLAENGRYVNTTIAVTPVTMYRVPLEALRAVLLEDSYLQFQFLAKITYELRESLRQKLLLVRRDAAGRVAMFFNQLAKQAAEEDARPNEIAVPMSRSDIASYLGLTLEAVSRATRVLTEEGVLEIPDRRVVRIRDRRRFDQIVAMS